MLKCHLHTSTCALSVFEFRFVSSIPFLFKEKETKKFTNNTDNADNMLKTNKKKFMINLYL